MSERHFHFNPPYKNNLDSFYNFFVPQSQVIVTLYVQIDIHVTGTGSDLIYSGTW